MKRRSQHSMYIDDEDAKQIFEKQQEFDLYQPGDICHIYHLEGLQNCLKQMEKIDKEENRL